MAHVQLHDVTKRFGDVEAVDAVNFEMESGSFTTLLGPSGCGKTTLDDARFPHLAVFDDVAYGPRAQGTSRRQVRKRVEKALDLIGMRGFARRYLRELSGGQQQRVALSRSIAVSLGRKASGSGWCRISPPTGPGCVTGCRGVALRGPSGR